MEARKEAARTSSKSPMLGASLQASCRIINHEAEVPRPLDVGVVQHHTAYSNLIQLLPSEGAGEIVREEWSI